MFLQSKQPCTMAVEGSPSSGWWYLKQSTVTNVWGGECLRWWTSGVVNVWGGERLILHWGWWTSGVVNVRVVNVLRSVKSSGCLTTGWQKLCESLKGLHRKVWTHTKILSLQICYFVEILKFVAMFALFGRLWANYIVYIAYYTEFNLQISNLKPPNMLFCWDIKICRHVCTFWKTLGKLHSIYCILYWVKFAN